MPVLLRKLIGFIRFSLHLLNKDVQADIHQILISLVPAKGVRKRTFVMLMGYTQSGKTFLVKHSELNDFASVSSAKIHDLINSRFVFLRDDNRISGEAYWERQFMTRYVRSLLLHYLMQRGYAVVNDSANLNSSQRAARLAIANKYGYRTVLIYVSCDTVTLHRRIVAADAQVASEGKPKVWLDLFQNIQSVALQLPLPSEADFVGVFKSGIDAPSDLNFVL